MLRKFCKRGHDLSVTRNKNHQCTECMKIWRREHPEACKSHRKDSAHKSRLKNIYHLTPEKYQEMYDAQNGLCILLSCGRPIGATDHNHLTGETRGLMCSQHNLALGLFSDSPQLLREAADYLERCNGNHQ